MALFKALYGRDPPTIVNYLEGSSCNDQVNHELQDRDELLRELKTKLNRAQERMKQHTDKHRRDMVLEERNWVFVRLQPYRQMYVRLQCQHKLSPSYFSPYHILKRVGNVAYKLEFPEAARIHPLFHVSQLKLCKGKPEKQVTPIPLLVTTGEDEVNSTKTNLEDKVLRKKRVML
ncbi:hypothetical protein HRI_000644800 [Hibiscus trionum]|uniref:Tf2-1-like SH3-like domain-containing protein n=1 Tax=Hibiscus trionum TaxID=183268 RepID=A0A9W7LNK2_HIBTR|nr:hypothetical protein HRI_000644800 [Hibiscus trionum]